MTTILEFDRWNSLPEEMKLECIKWLDLRTRFLLRSTSRTERRLVNSQRFKLTKVSLTDGDSEYGKHMKIYIFEKSLDGRFIAVELTKEEMVSTAFPFISFLLENADITYFSCTADEDDVLKDLRFLTRILELRVRKFDGYVTRHMLPFLEKCRPNTLEKLEIHYESRRSFPMEEFLKYPIIDSVKRWYLSVYESEDLGQKISQKWMELDVDIGSEYKFQRTKNENMESFVEAFPERKVFTELQQTDESRIRKPEKNYETIVQSITAETSEGFRNFWLHAEPADNLSGTNLAHCAVVRTFYEKKAEGMVLSKFPLPKVPALAGGVIYDLMGSIDRLKLMSTSKIQVSKMIRYGRRFQEKMNLDVSFNRFELKIKADDGEGGETVLRFSIVNAARILAHLLKFCDLGSVTIKGTERIAPDFETLLNSAPFPMKIEELFVGNGVESNITKTLVAQAKEPIERVHVPTIAEMLAIDVHKIEDLECRVSEQLSDVPNDMQQLLKWAREKAAEVDYTFFFRFDGVNADKVLRELLGQDDSENPISCNIGEKRIGLSKLAGFESTFMFSVNPL